MRSVQPEVFLVARPAIDYDQLATYLQEVGGEKWLERLDRGELASDAENLAEFAGKMCYRAWEPGLNPNVRKVRNDHEAYLQNILKQAHGSVLEHASFTFVLHNISRVFSHELVRHRPGTAVSQESLRFVRLDDIPFWFPDWAREVRTTGVPFRITDGEAQIVAVRQGLGMTTLPCFVGDADPLLVRVPGTDLHMYGTLWLLTQGETRKTKRVRLFMEFVSLRLSAYAPLLAGMSISRG